MGRVRTRDGWWRIRSRPDGPSPWSLSNNGDLLRRGRDVNVCSPGKGTNVTDLELWSYPEETLSTEPRTRSVCRESLAKPDSDLDSGDSERGPNGDERGLGSPMFD